MLESVNRTDVNKMFLCVEVSQSFALIIDFCDNIVNCNFKCPLFKKNAARQSPVLARGQELPFSQKNRIIWLADNRSSNARSA